MRNDEKNITTDDSLDRARQLIQMLIDDEVSDGLHNKLRRWFENDPEDGAVEQALAELRDFGPQEEAKLTPAEREKFLRLCEKLNIPVAQAAPEREVLQINKKPWRRRIALRVAAVLLPIVVILGVGYLSGWFGPSLMDELNMTAYTLEGVQKNITLDDSTQVWVNSSSRLSYPERFAAGERHVKLEGEAFFDVAKDSKKPFVVHTENLHVKVLGTQFNIVELTQEGVTEVTLHSGRVKITVGGKSTRLDPGHRLRLTHSTGDISVEPFSDYRDWRSDEVNAENRTLPELFRMIANYYDREIVFDEAKLNGTSLFTTKFGRNSHPEEVIAALARLTGEFEYDVKDNVIYIKIKDPENGIDAPKFLT